MVNKTIFRGKRKDNGEWVEGFLINKFYWNGQDWEVSQSFIIPVKANLKIRHGFIEGKDIYEVIPETVGQYTGLKDKNGNEIFEGDIIENIYPNKHLAVVEYSDLNPTFQMRRVQSRYFFPEIEYDFIKCDLQRTKIVGNIYDNQDLLTEVEE